MTSSQKAAPTRRRKQDRQRDEKQRLVWALGCMSTSELLSEIGRRTWACLGSLFQPDESGRCNHVMALHGDPIISQVVRSMQVSSDGVLYGGMKTDPREVDPNASETLRCLIQEFLSRGAGVLFYVTRDGRSCSYSSVREVAIGCELHSRTLLPRGSGGPGRGTKNVTG